MDSVEPLKTYEPIDHACRACFGRLGNEVIDGKRTGIVRCMECGFEGKGHLSVCACGTKLRTGLDAGLRCIRNPDVTADMPNEIIVRSAVEVKGV